MCMHAHKNTPLYVRVPSGAYADDDQLDHLPPTVNECERSTRNCDADDGDHYDRIILAVVVGRSVGAGIVGR